MAVVLHGEVSELETALPDERAQLVRLCANLSGDADAAEDLAQETLLEAWRNAHKLQDPAGRGRWLAAIARNVCLRRRRSRGRELSRLAHPWQGDPAQPSVLDKVADAGADLEVELEREELARLLDRALGLLPPDTRAVLVERLIHESPQAEAAARLGLSEGAVAVRLHRGRLALRRLLATELGAEAREYGLTSERDTLGETRIWCPLCGQRRLVGRLDSRTGELLTRCPDCTPAPATAVSNPPMPELTRGVRGYRSAIIRLMAWAEEYYARGLPERAAPCMSCGRRMPLGIVADDALTLSGLRYTIQSHCAACGFSSQSALLSITLSLPAGRRFWRDHPRVRTLPECDVEVDGRHAVVSSVESVTDGAGLDVVIAPDPYEIVSVHER